MFSWFHDGCCECVGDKCLNYGINESRCPLCPKPKDILDFLGMYNEDDLLELGFLEEPKTDSISKRSKMVYKKRYQQNFNIDEMDDNTDSNEDYELYDYQTEDVSYTNKENPDYEMLTDGMVK